MIWKLFLMSVLLSVNAFGSDLKAEALEFVPAAERVQVQAETEKDVARRYGMRRVDYFPLKRNSSKSWFERFQYAAKCDVALQSSLFEDSIAGLSKECEQRKLIPLDKRELRSILSNERIPYYVFMQFAELALLWGGKNKKTMAVDALWWIMADPDLPEELNEQAYHFILEYGDWAKKQPMLDVLLGNAYYRSDLPYLSRLSMLNTVCQFGDSYYQAKALEINKEIDALYYEPSGGGACLPY